MERKEVSFFNRMFRGSKALWWVVLFIGLFSAVELYSASSQLVIEKDDVNAEISGHFYTLVVGAVMAVVMSHAARTRRRVAMLTWTLGAVGMVCVLILLLPEGLSPHVRVAGIPIIETGTENGASRWIVLMGVRFQPSELLKLGVVSSVAWVLTAPGRFVPGMKWLCRMANRDMSDEEWVDKVRFVMGTAVSAVAFMVVFSENLSTALLIGGVGVALTWVSGTWGRGRTVSMVALVAMATIAVATLHMVSDEGLRRMGAPERAHTWKHRLEEKLREDETTRFEYNDVRRQTVHSQIAIARGSGWIGRLPGNSVERDFLPQIYADFVFAIIVEELGFVLGAVLLMSLYLALMWRCCAIARMTRDNYLTMVLIGFGVLIVTQAVMSMGVAANVGPVTGQPLPLISRGKTSILITFMMIGIIQGIAEMTIRRIENKKNNGHEEVENNG